MGSARGQSETLDTLALIAVVVSLSLVIGTGVLADVDTTSEPLLDVSLDATESDVTISHAGGDPINTTVATVVLRGDGNQSRFRMANATISGDGDREFEVGEELTHGQNVSNSTVRVVIVHETTNSILVDKTVDVTLPAPAAVVIAGNQAPTATFTYSPSPPSANQKLTFDGSSSSDTDGSITAYEWDWTSNGTYEATGVTANHTFDSTGTYNVTLRTTDDNGETDTSTVELSLTSIAPTAVFSYSPQTPGKQQTITFNASASVDDDGSITSYEWDWTSDGTYDATGETATHSYGSTGTYTVTLRVTDNEGLTSTTTEVIVVNTNDAPTADFTYSPSNPTTDQPISFDATSSSDPDGTISSYQWDWTDDGTYDATGSSPSHSYGSTGTYTVELKVTDDDGATDTTTKSVDISESVGERWLTFQNDSVNSGSSDNVGPTDSLSEMWTYSADGEFNAAGAAVDGRYLYVGTKSGTVYSFNTRTGSERWNYSAGSEIRGTPAVDGSTLYIGTKGKELLAIYVDNGTERWSYGGIDEVVQASPTVKDGVVYIGDKKKRVHAVDATDGSKVWKEKVASGEIRSTPAVVDGAVYVADKQGNVYRLDTADGSTEWSSSHGSEYIKSSPVVHNGSIYIGEKGTGSVKALETSSGDLEWSRDLGSSVYGTPVVHRGTLYVGAKSGTLYALDADEGSTIWSVSIGSEIKASAAVANGSVYVVNKTGDLAVLSSGSGEIQATYSMSGSDILSAPAVANGTVFVGDTGKTLHAIEGDLNPVADFRFSPVEPVESETVSFNGSWSSQPGGAIQSYEWDFTNDGTYDATGVSVTHEYSESGTYTVELKVTDSAGNTDSRTRSITVSPTTFEDETSTANLGTSPGGGAIVFADLNEDGYLDVFMNDNDYGSNSVRLRENQGDMTFKDRDGRIAVDGGRGAGAGDFDDDGDTDLIVGVGQKINENTGNFVFSDSTAGAGNNEEALMFVDIDGDGDLDVWSFGEDYMWHENTNTGWTSHKTLPGTTDHEISNGEGATAADINNDGYIDLMFAQSDSDVDAWLNDGDYTYTEQSVGNDLNLPEDVGDHEDMEWAWGDYDSDGDMDVFISGDDNEGLYRNDGTGTFTEVTSSAGISESNPDGAAWGDYDNDGHLDLIVTETGGVSGLYNNDGDGTFTDKAAEANVGDSGDLGDTVGWFDADNDGDLDILTNDKLTFWNNTRDDGEYLRVIVEGTSSPKTPIGAQIDLYEADTGTLVGHRELLASQNQLQPPLRQHFGVKPNSRYDIRVRFPSGTVVWRNDTVPSEESVSIGGNTLDNTVRINESGPLFEDDFDRSDANTLGFGWKGYEVESDDARIANNRLDFEPDNNGERPSVRHTFDKQTSGKIKLNFTFNFERTDNEQFYSVNIQLGDGKSMADPNSAPKDGVGVNVKWGGNDGDIADMTDEEGFGYSVDGVDTQIGVVSGEDGANTGGNATVSVTVDLDQNEYNITVTGPGLVSGSGTATEVPFENNNVDIDTVRVFLDEVAPGNFGDLEIDDIEVTDND